jgi:hypothetical protein
LLDRGGAGGAKSGSTISGAGEGSETAIHVADLVIVERLDGLDIEGETLGFLLHGRR